MRKLGIVSNCQTHGLAEAVRGLLRDVDVSEIPVGNFINRDQRQRINESLHDFDHIWILPLGPQFGDFSEALVRKKFQNISLFPALLFFGFHPDVTYLPDRYRATASPLGEYHSALVIAAFLSGRTVRETVGMFNRFVYAKLGYLDAFTRDSQAVIQAYQRYGIDVRTAFSKWRRSGCFMHSPNHPTCHVMRDLAELMCKTAGIELDSVTQLGNCRDTLEDHPRFPVYPEIAEAVGLSGSLMFRLAAQPGLQTAFMSLVDFVQGSFDAYTALPISGLRAAVGVDRALQAISH